MFSLPILITRHYACDASALYYHNKNPGWAQYARDAVAPKMETVARCCWMNATYSVAIGFYSDSDKQTVFNEDSWRN